MKYTYRRDDQMSRSWPDHIITLSHYVHLINDIACNECVDNFSDRLFLSFTMHITHPLTLASSQSKYPVNSQFPDRIELTDQGLVIMIVKTTVNIIYYVSTSLHCLILL